MNEECSLQAGDSILRQGGGLTTVPCGVGVPLAAGTSHRIHGNSVAVWGLCIALDIIEQLNCSFSFSRACLAEEGH